MWSCHKLNILSKLPYIPLPSPRSTRPPFTIAAEHSAHGILLENIDFVVLCICHSSEFENLVLRETFLISAQQPQLWHAHQEARLDEPRQAD